MLGSQNGEKKKIRQKGKIIDGGREENLKKSRSRSKASQ